MERQTGYEKGIYHQKTVNAKMALISGQFNLRHVIAGLAQRRDQTRQVRRIAFTNAPGRSCSRMRMRAKRPERT